MIRLGITGTIGSGKSTVGKLLTELGVPVIDTDTVVQQLYENSDALKADFKAAFGPHVYATLLNEKGQLDKTRLRPLVFDHPDHRQTINRLVHPRVREQVDAFFAADTLALPMANQLRAVLVPLLFESDALFETDTKTRYDTVWAVVTDEAVLVERLMARDHCTRQTVENKLAAQWPQSQKAAMADTVIDNSGTLEETRQQVHAALAALCPAVLESV